MCASCKLWWETPAVGTSVPLNPLRCATRHILDDCIVLIFICLLLDYLKSFKSPFLLFRVLLHYPRDRSLNKTSTVLCSHRNLFHLSLTFKHPNVFGWTSHFDFLSLIKDLFIPCDPHQGYIGTDWFRWSNRKSSKRVTDSQERKQGNIWMIVL